MDSIELLLNSVDLQAPWKNPAFSTMVAGQFGGKSAGLARLVASRHRLNVPAWIALREEGIRIALAPATEAEVGQQQTILAAIGALASPKNSGTPDRAKQGGKIPLAIRSSVVGEDGTEHSFAGMFASVLNVQGEEAVLDAIKTVFESFDTPAVQEYLKARQLAPGSLKPAILVQRMVDARAAGIAFTTPKGALVESISGLGDRLAAGLESGDSWEIDRRGRILSLSVAAKAPSLCQRDLRTLARALENLRRIFGDDNGKGVPHGLDVEFAFEKGSRRVQILQVRPQTVKAPADDAAQGISAPDRAQPDKPTPDDKLQQHEPWNRRIWDNSNIVESYSGITLPLSFSFIRVAYRAVYRQFCELAGIPRATIAANDSLFSNMLGIFGGRVYYNLLNWYRLLALLPGYSFNRRAMEEMMGVGTSLDDEDGANNGGANNGGANNGGANNGGANSDSPKGTPQHHLARIFVHGPALLRTLCRLVGLWFGSARGMDRFIRDFYTRYQHYDSLDFDSMDDRALLALRRELEREILARWKAPIVNDLVAMVAMGVLTRLLKPLGGDPNALLVHSGGIPSAALATGLEELARLIARDSSRATAFIEGDGSTRRALVDNAPPESGISQHWHAWLKRNGARGSEEMKLESRPIGEDATLCLDLVAGLVQKIQADTDAPQPAPPSREGSTTPPAAPRGRLDAARPGQGRARRPPVLEGLRLKPGLRQSLFITYVLERTRRAIRDRERQRFCRAEAYSLMRRLFAAIGRHWARDGVLDDPRDIFWLEWDEIERAIEGAQDLVAFRALVSMRKESRTQSAGMAPPDRFETGGIPAFSPIPARPAAGSTAELSGIGASPGCVEGRILKLDRPDSSQDLAGRIVLARQTDPGWIVIFPAIAALIVEKGSILSHSAIVARELALPCIVGARGAFNRLADGDLVRMDGATGHIRPMGEA